MYMTLSVLSIGEGFFNVIYTEPQGLLGVQTEENQMEESVVMVTYHDKGSFSSIGMALEQTMRTKEGKLPLLFVSVNMCMQIPNTETRAHL